MADNRGGRRAGAGRKRGSKNKATIARAAVAEILDVDDAETLEAAVHQRGHRLLLELERIALDPTQPVAARIVAARVALPFLLDTRVRSRPTSSHGMDPDELVRRLQAGRERVAQRAIEHASTS